MKFIDRGTTSFIHGGKEREAKTRSKSEMPVWTVSQRFCYFSGGDHSKNYGADQQRLQISYLHFRQIPYFSHVCLLEDKVRDRGMYLFTNSNGSNAMDQRSGFLIQ